MTRTRIACASFSGWLFLLFNVERFHEPLNVASFVYVIAAVAAVAIVGVKQLGATPIQWLLVGPLSAFFALKFIWGYPLVGQALPITIVEICAIVLTVSLAHVIASRLYALEQASAAIVSEDFEGQAESLETAQGAMYREVRRARQHTRPLAVLAVASSGENLKPTEEHLLREMQRELLQKYTNARIADLLSREARDHGIVSQRNRHFVVLLPETDRDSAEQIVRQLNATVRNQLGLKLQVGLSTFPDEEVTLVGLLQRAEAAMRSGGEGTRRSETPSPAIAANAPLPASPPIRDTTLEEPALKETLADVSVIARDTSRELEEEIAAVGSGPPRLAR